MNERGDKKGRVLDGPRCPILNILKIPFVHFFFLYMLACVCDKHFLSYASLVGQWLSGYIHRWSFSQTQDIINMIRDTCRKGFWGSEL